MVGPELTAATDGFIQISSELNCLVGTSSQKIFSLQNDEQLIAHWKMFLKRTKAAVPWKSPVYVTASVTFSMNTRLQAKRGRQVLGLNEPTV